MASLAKQISKEQVINALEYIIENNISLKSSKKYNLEYKENFFPPKEVVRWAAKLANIPNWETMTLNGGANTNDPLEVMGFKINNNVDVNANILKFSQIINDLGVYLLREDTILKNFKVPKVKDDSTFVWIADNQNMIGDTIAHYEIRLKGNKIYTEIHFEGSQESKDNFHQKINSLPENIEWFTWQKSKSIRFNKTFDFNEENLIEKLASSLLYLEQNIGDKVRGIINNINHSMNKTIELLKYKKQIILQGPPGTGKTREAKLIAKEMLGLSDVEELKDNEQFKIIQFHPSYTYEDFVRGIVAESKGEKIEYKNVNKTLGEFAEKALKNYQINSQNQTINNKDIWINEKFEDFKNEIEKDVEEKEINLSGNINLFKVESDNFRYGKDWATPSRINFSDFKILIKAILENQLEISLQKIPKELSVHAHYRYTYYNALLKKFFENYSYQGENYSEPLKNYVLIIDEINRANLSSVLGELIYSLEYRGEAVDSMYAVENSILPDKNHLILPPNLYIIGTMNTADRSVGHIDYAIRRRFAFVDVLPEKLSETDEIYFNTTGYKAVEKLFTSNLVSNEFDVKDVQIGHSYFITKKEEATNELKRDAVFKMKMDYEIKPILKEYLKDGIFVDGKQIDGKDIKMYIEDLA